MKEVRIMVRRLLSVLVLITILLSSFSFVINAYELETEDVVPGGYYLYNFENDLIMAESETDKVIFPASTVKIMTACIALEADIHHDKIITVTAEMLEDYYGVNMRLKAGDKLTYRDLLYALINYGYNDAAYVIALTVCDTSEEFVELMNQKARDLGMTSTTYVNFTGLFEEGMMTTIKDIVTLSKYMTEKEEYMEISSEKAYQLSDYATCSTKIINNRSTLFGNFKGFASFNTGSERYGGCAVLHYKKGGLTFLCVVMNANFTAEENKDKDPIKAGEIYARELLFQAVYGYSLKNIYTTKNVISTLPVKYATKGDNIKLYPSEDISVFLPNNIDIEKDLSYTTNIFSGELEAPVKNGDIVGELIVSLDGQILAKTSLVVKDDVERNLFLYTLDIMQDYILSRAFLLTILFFLLVMIIYYIAKKRKINKMHKKSSRLGQRNTKRK